MPDKIEKSQFIGDPIHPGDIEINEVFLEFLIAAARRNGKNTELLKLALERIKNGKDWRTGE